MGFEVREAFHWIRRSILIQPDSSRAREDLSRPLLDICCFFLILFRAIRGSVESFLDIFQKFAKFQDSGIVRKWRAAKFHAESTSYHAEINFLDLFRERWGFLLFDHFGRRRRRRRRKNFQSCSNPHLPAQEKNIPVQGNPSLR